MKLRWPLLTLGLVGAGALLMAPGPRRGQPGANPNPRAPALEVLRSGSGMSHVRPLCETALAMGLLTGNSAFCLSGDGTQWSDGGTNMVAVGNPLTVSVTTCPSGPNCTAQSVQLLDGGNPGTTAQNYWTGSNKAAPAGSFSSCVFYKPTEATNRQQLLSKDVSGNRSIEFAIHGGTGVPYLNIYNSDAGVSVLQQSTALSLSPQLACYTLDTADAGTALYTTGKSTVFGFSGGEVNPAPGSQWRLGARQSANPFNDPFAGHIYGAFLTERVLTAAQVSALDSAVRGTLTGSRGEAITTTRNSTMFCTNEDESAGTTLAPNSPCVRKGGLLSEPAGTNVLLRSEALATTWTTSGATVTSDTAIAPDGTLTADTVALNDTSGGGAAFVRQSSVAWSAGAIAHSFWVKGASTSGTLYAYAYDGAFKALATCAYTSTAWTRCSATGTVGTGGGKLYDIGINTSDANQTGQPARSVYIWGAQVEAGAYPSSYVRTEGSTASRVASYHTVASTLADIPVGANTAYCMGATWVPPTGATAWADMGSGVALTAIGTNYSSANEAFLYVDASTGKVTLDTFDNANAQKLRLTSAGISFASHRIVGCNDKGTLQVWVDGVPVAMDAASGAGTGLITTTPSTHDVGSLNSGATGYQEKGIVKDICIGPLGSCQ